jgi:hypothetical protein
MGKPFFKEPRVSQKIRNTLRRRVRTAAEDKEKARVRQRDKRCRVPLCGCGRFGLGLKAGGEVSHRRHKGMGGNPTGDRSVAALMIYICAARHKEHIISLDKKTLRWEPLTKAGAAGAIRWLLDAELWRELTGQRLTPTVGGWFELAREAMLGQPEPLTPLQRDVLTELGNLEV